MEGRGVVGGAWLRGGLDGKMISQIAPKHCTEFSSYEGKIKAMKFIFKYRKEVGVVCNFPSCTSVFITLPVPCRNSHQFPRSIQLMKAFSRLVLIGGSVLLG